MCQLLGISSRAPIRLRVSWERFARHGSQEGGNPDGWGVAYAAGGDVCVLKEPAPAADSRLVAFLGRNGPPATTVVSHVRRATLGAGGMCNTQPFGRALGGRNHVFAHNGHVTGIEPPASPWLRPVGTTDSEVLFSILLHRLEPLWRGATEPSLAARTEVIAGFAEEMRSRGALNFLYFDGRTLFAHAHRRTIRGAGISTEPGLFLLRCVHHSGDAQDDPCAALQCMGSDTTRAVVATRPLSERGWEPLPGGTLLRLQDGDVV